MSKITRRRFLGLSALALPAIVGADALLGEPTRLRVTQLKLSESGKCRFVQFSDLHYAGDADYANTVINTINNLQPEFVCFTGDLTEDCRFAAEAFDFIRQIKTPVYGIPGNHDYLNSVPFGQYERVFAKTGGSWMPQRSITIAEHNVELVGLGIAGMPKVPAPEGTRRVMLIHYPVMADHLNQPPFDVILAGHSHGGQVRLPFVGALKLPSGVGDYDYGRYETAGGPLYVNAGVGTLSDFPIRWNCPPEITVVTI